MNPESFYPVIISGGPGSGKTTVIEHLKLMGYKTYEEVPRTLIQDQLIREKPVLPWTDLSFFAELCFTGMMEQKQKPDGSEIVFFDRAIGDILAYMKIGGIDPPSLYREEAIKGYDGKVFLFKPDKDIYRQDEVRPHSFSEALEIHKVIVSVYTDLGFETVEVPFLPVAKQVGIVLGKIE